MQSRQKCCRCNRLAYTQTQVNAMQTLGTVSITYLYTWINRQQFVIVNTVIVNLGQLKHLLDGRLRCGNRDGYLTCLTTQMKGLSTTILLRCDVCGTQESWNADEGRLTFPSSNGRSTSSATVRMVFAMIAVGMARKSCNMILQSMNIKVRISPWT